MLRGGINVCSSKGCFDVRSRPRVLDLGEAIAVWHAKVVGAHFNTSRHRAHLNRLSLLTSRTRIFVELDHGVCIGVELVTSEDLLSS